MSDLLEFSPIRVEQTSWCRSRSALTAIRHQVFVIEQGVPLEAEIDSDDPAALHWVALNTQSVAMGTARLVGNRVGRMAVLSDHRGTGVGASLLRAIIKHAHEAGIDTLVLDAQTHALPFYEKFGFVVCGEEFDDVGIPHHAMRLPLNHRKQHHSSLATDTERRQRTELGSAQSDD